MKDWKEILILPDESIQRVIEIIDASAKQIALVVDRNSRLLGTVTDGDIRRGMLKGLTLNEPVDKIMNPNPTVATIQDDRETILALMKRKTLRQIPIVNNNYQVVSVDILEDLIMIEKRDNFVVIMAGGLGSRLSPLTNECPKPLLKVGTKPILETILKSFIDQGFWQFYIAVNYRAEMVKEYFGDGSRWGVEIRYIHENKRMGTAGALSLINQCTELPILVMNGDLLTKVDFKHLLDFHFDQRALGTMCVREYEFQIPYGVVNVDKYRLKGIEEKPTQRFFVSAGIYVLEPKVMELIPEDRFFDMPALFEKMIEQKWETVVFPIREYWLDIGRIEDYEKANGEYQVYFEGQNS